tara:strand:- start:1662 stop:2144 length:483 start_codon:yes stop_codon:yes gene_type:complete
MKMKVLILTFLVLLTILAFSPVKADQMERYCLAEAVYFEARGEGWKGMLAVGVVIQNRVRDTRYPSTICEVVRQGYYKNGLPIKHKCQFSYYCDGKPETVSEQIAWQNAQSIAEMLLSTKVQVEGLENSTHYHAVWVQPSWSKQLSRSKKFGNHVFYSRR